MNDRTRRRSADTPTPDASTSSRGRRRGLADVDLTHAPLTVSWDLQDRQNTIVPDGTYTIRMKVADLNSTTPAENNQGTFTFVKGAQPQMQTGLTVGGFTNVAIQFAPVLTPGRPE